jgi:hypothetical protein
VGRHHRFTVAASEIHAFRTGNRAEGIDDLVNHLAESIGKRSRSLFWGDFSH